MDGVPLGNNDTNEVRDMSLNNHTARDAAAAEQAPLLISAADSIAQNTTLIKQEEEMQGDVKDVSGDGSGAKCCPFSLLPHGGLASSGFNLASATLGAGTLALPNAVASGGVGIGALFLFICCTSTVYGIRLLMATQEATGHATFESMARHLLGPLFEKLTALLMVLFCWGITVVYVVAMGDILSPLRSLTWFPAVFHGVWGLRLLTLIFWATFMLPLSLAREINTLRYASLAGMAATAILVTAIVIHAASAPTIPDDHYIIAKFDLDMVTSLPIIIFSYCCQTNAFEIYTELHHRSVRRMTLAAGVSMAACTALYLICGIAGALEFGPNTEENILKNYPNPTKVPYIAFAFVCISLTLTMAFPICTFPPRDAVLQVLGYKDAYSAPARARIPVAAALATTSVAAGLFAPGIKILFALLGSICGSSISFILPSLFALRSGAWTVERVGRLNVIATWVMLAFGIVAAFFGTVVTIYKEFF